jgi:hypothetical protein
MNCDCKKLSDSIYLDDMPKKTRKFLTKVDTDFWIELYKCECCSQLWHIDVWDKYQIQFAFKIQNKSNWKVFDRVPLEKKLLIKSRGGLISKKCNWYGCDKDCVKGVVFCIDHLYQNGTRK